MRDGMDGTDGMQVRELASESLWPRLPTYSALDHLSSLAVLLISCG